jgi:hypothetical protein
MKIHIEFRDAIHVPKDVDGVDYVFLANGCVELHKARVNPTTREKANAETDLILGTPFGSVLYFEVL